MNGWDLALRQIKHNPFRSILMGLGVADGIVYVGSDDGIFYALRTESKGLANSPWPKFRANITNNGSKIDPLSPRLFKSDTTRGH